MTLLSSNILLYHSVSFGQDYFLGLLPEKESESSFISSEFANNFYCYSLSSSEFVISSNLFYLSKLTNSKSRQILEKEGFFLVFSFPFFCKATIYDHRFYSFPLIFLYPFAKSSNYSQEFSCTFSEYARLLLENWNFKNEQAISSCKKGKKFKYKTFNILLNEWSELANQLKQISSNSYQFEVFWQKIKRKYFFALKKQLKNWFWVQNQFAKPSQKKLIFSMFPLFCDKLKFIFYKK